MAKRPPDSEQDRLLRPLATRDGAEVFVWDRVAEAIRLGAGLREAAARCGIPTPTLHGWIRSGTRLVAAVEGGGRLASSLSPRESAEVRLANAVEEAHAEAKLLLLALLERVSRGVEIRTITVQMDASGQEVGRFEKTEQKGPDAATIRWRLEKGWPDEFGRRVEVVGPDGGAVQVDLHERAAELAAAIRAKSNGSSPKANGSPVA